MLLHLSHFLPFIPLHPAYPLPPAFPTLVHVHGHTYKFFGFYIFCTFFNFPLSIFYLPFMLFILCNFSPSLPVPLPY